MRKRFRVNKSKSARSFRKQSGKTARANLAVPMRGGYRL